MQQLTRRKAILVAAATAVIVYGGALANRWALDDHPIIGSNPAAHSVKAALEAAFHPYWPPSAGVEAGLYRPLTILSYAVDWAVSGGVPAWFHLVNMLLHGVATALLVVLLLEWLPPAGALVAGLVFGVHPVHVEAVANVVGRAEILATIGLFAAVLSARRYRRAVPEARRRWLAATAGALLLAMLSKESGVVGIALIALDEWIEKGGMPAVTDELYVACAGVTIGWLFLWRAIAGQYVSTTVAANFRELNALQRIWTMLPAQLHVVRLLTWPLELSPEYNPQLVPQYRTLSAVGVLGGLVSVSILALGIAQVRRAPVLAFGILAAIVAYAPTSNLLVPSGVALAERALYLAAMAPAAAAGFLWVSSSAMRRVVVGGITALLVVYALRSVTRVPFWADSRTVIIEDVLQHPDNFRAHTRVASILAARGDTVSGLAEYRAAEAIFPPDPFMAPLIVPLALGQRRFALAREEAVRADSLEPRNPAIARLPIDVELAAGRADSAIAVAGRAAARVSDSPLLASLYYIALQRAHSPRWRELAALARVGALEARFGATGPLLDSLALLAPTAGGGAVYCDELRKTLPYITLIRPKLLPVLQSVRGRDGQTCRVSGARP